VIVRSIEAIQELDMSLLSGRCSLVSDEMVAYTGCPAVAEKQ